MKTTKTVIIRNKEVEIDINCVPLVILFNKIGLDSKFCCQGHRPEENFNIMFEDYIDDNIIIDFISQYSNKYKHSPFHGKFVKWCRKMKGKIKFNWIYIAENTRHALMDYEIIKNNQ